MVYLEKSQPAPASLAVEKQKASGDYFRAFPVEHIDIVALDDSAETQNTKELLLVIYNGTTPLKKLESANLRVHILNEIAGNNPLSVPAGE